MATKIWVNIGLGYGLLPEGTKPLPEPMLTNHRLGSVAIAIISRVMKIAILLKNTFVELLPRPSGANELQ